MPSVPISRRHALVAVAVLVLALVLAGRLARGAGAPAPARVLPAAAVRGTTPKALLVVDVVGAVRRPGLYRLRTGARNADAIARAGGATRRAELELVNLAAPVSDGMQIVVPRRGATGGAQPAAGSAAGPVHLNSATLEQLDTLPGVGPITARKILDYRTEHGSFRTLDELDAIPGIGPARLEQLREAAAP